MTTWLLYGANGYTGTLIAEEAARRGMKPILAGRSEAKIRPLAERLGLKYRIFALTSPEVIAAELGDIATMFLAAGPYSRTSRPVIDACLATGTHYLDITGEIPVLEAIQARDSEAEKAGCVLMPGVGFDAVASDCLAVSLKRALPDADHLVMAVADVNTPSRGTTKTMVEGFAVGGAVRQNGQIRTVPLAWKTAEIPFRDGARTAVSIPWSDVSTAYYSTGIPNIESYAAAPKPMLYGMWAARLLRKVFEIRAVQDYLGRQIDARVTGPSTTELETGRSQMWGKVTNARGQEVTGTLETPEAYKLTVLTSVETARRVTEGEVTPGFKTPGMGFGADYITEFAGCTLDIAPAR